MAIRSTTLPRVCLCTLTMSGVSNEAMVASGLLLLKLYLNSFAFWFFLSQEMNYINLFELAIINFPCKESLKQSLISYYVSMSLNILQQSFFPEINFAMIFCFCNVKLTYAVFTLFLMSVFRLIWWASLFNPSLTKAVSE